jgi:CheY-like chemotaxis protein
MSLPRILIVDDNADSAETLAMLLELYGYPVRTAGDGPAALAAGAAFLPQAVLLDIGLPGMDGYEVCRRIRGSEWGRDALLVAVTGWAEESTGRAREAGFDAHLVKPVEPSALQKILQRVHEPH